MMGLLSIPSNAILQLNCQPNNTLIDFLKKI